MIKTPKSIRPKLRNVCGSRIRATRQKLDLTQEDLSKIVTKKVGVLSRSTLAKIEAQIRCVTDYEVLALAKSLGVSVNTLLS